MHNNAIQCYCWKILKFNKSLDVIAGRLDYMHGAMMASRQQSRALPPSAQPVVASSNTPSEGPRPPEPRCRSQRVRVLGHHQPRLCRARRKVNHSAKENQAEYHSAFKPLNTAFSFLETSVSKLVIKNKSELTALNAAKRTGPKSRRLAPSAGSGLQQEGMPPLAPFPAAVMQGPGSCVPSALL